MVWRDFYIRSCSFIKCNVIVARWLIQHGGSDVTGKIKMDIISGEEDGDVKGWDKEVSVYSVRVWWISFGMGCREDLLFHLVIIFYSMSRVREESPVLLCFETGTTSMFKPFFCIYGEWDFGYLHLCWKAPTGLPHCKPGREMRQKWWSVDKKQHWEGRDWRICKSPFLMCTSAFGETCLESNLSYQLLNI